MKTVSYGLENILYIHICFCPVAQYRGKTHKVKPQVHEKKYIL